MGNSFSNIWKKLFKGDQDCRILMIGLDNAGKTTILYKLNSGKIIHTVPTIGFNMETIEYEKMTMNIWDIGGQDKIRQLWKYYYQNTDAIIFVVDSSDSDRLGLVCEEINKLLHEDELRNAILLVMANKQDKKGALSVGELGEILPLKNIKTRQWYIQGTNAHTGDGLYDGLSWLSKKLKSKKK